ncbi:uncharacterized protein N7529_005627 [Penicillium soppii]|uniref:uncharacterized protein n=1 Tax=Penicillium soppii TaxID=69789 RepID=UPI002548B5EE|nr:uncharacterized protein N7529_005627 [Penicillium soppii]KAJ5863711.1 hypothetical protein N7529_005627 [Penicillium soppii]
MTTPFFAAAGYKAPITVNGDPLRIGLHLVHPRDPMKRLVEIGPNGEPIETDLFSYFNAFIVPPTLIDPKEPDYTWNFKLAQVDLQRFPRVSKANGGHTSVWTYQPGSCNLRLRCIRLGGKPVPVEGNLKSVQNNLGSADGTSDSVGGKYGSGKGKRGSVEEIKWAVSPTYWPSVFYITVNGKELQVRRKVHNGKDLPLDITQHLKAGDNSIRIDLLLGKDECKDNQYHFGVEIMEVTAFEDILHLVQPIPAADARASIQKRLTPIANDDDLAVVTDSLTINLVDPFMARIFDVPVRSKNCTHAECFDRDTFIRTRKSASGRAPMVDSWRCPVCKADARPKSLVVDYFLAEIHAELARTNRLDGAQAVQVNADGTWVLRTNTDDTSPAPQGGSHSGPTSQKRKSVSDDALEPAATRPRLDYKPDVSQPLVSRHYHEVIELD